MALFEKYGEFDTHEELNAAAEGQKEQGDMASLTELAKENGIEQYDLEDYINGEIDTLCDPLSAALGKLRIEREALGDNNYLADDVIEFLKANCENKSMQIAIRKKGKRVEKAFSGIQKYATKHKYKMGADLVGYCGPMVGYQIIKDYYFSEE